MSPRLRLAPLARVRLLAEDAQPVGPAQTGHLSIVTGCVDGDQEGGFVLLPAPGTEDFQGVRYFANSVPRGRTQPGLCSVTRGAFPARGCTVGTIIDNVTMSVC
jgi:hypothetical protein